MELDKHIAELNLEEVVTALEDWNVHTMWADFEKEQTGSNLADFGRSGLRVQRMLLQRLRELLDMEARHLNTIQVKCMADEDILLNKTLNLQIQGAA